MDKSLASYYTASLTDKSKRDKLTAEVRESRINALREYAESLRPRYKQQLLAKLDALDINDHSSLESEVTRRHVSTEVTAVATCVTDTGNRVVREVLAGVRSLFASDTASSVHEGPSSGHVVATEAAEVPVGSASAMRSTAAKH